MSECVFHSVTLDAFRGFNEQAEIDLRGTAVLLRGPNGTGKTSVFDALQWLLLGSVDRLWTLRDLKNDEHLVNAYRTPGPAVVEAKIEVDGQLTTVRRTGSYRGSDLICTLAEGTELRGAEATDFLSEALAGKEGPDFASLLLSSGLLQQDVVRTLLESRPAERFAALSHLLRLGDLEEFQDAVQRALESINSQTSEARRVHAEARRRLDDTSAQAESLRDSALRAGREETAGPTLEQVLKMHEAVLRLADAVPGTAQAARFLASEASVLRIRAQEIAGRLSELNADERSAPPVSEQALVESERKAGEAEKSLEASGQALAQRETAHRKFEARAEDLARLAAIALDMLDSHCPVCEQEIDPAQVRERLQHRATNASELMRSRQDLEAARKARSEANDAFQDALKDLKALKARQAERDRTTHELNGLRKELTGLADYSRAIVVGDSVELSDADLARLSDALDSVRDAANAEFARLSVSEDALKLADVEVRLEALREQEAEQKRAVESLSQAQERSKTLLDGTKEARVAVVEERFDRLRPLVRDLFARLDAHRAFKELDLEPQRYGKPGTAVMARTRDPDRGITANPALVFSTSQANVAALSYFLALSCGAGDDGLPFVMLDDPIQSMDDVNVLAFADICRFIRERRQLLVSTHEKRFADLLERKLAPRREGERTVVLDFFAWSREGPRYRQRILESVEDPEAGYVDQLSAS